MAEHRPRLRRLYRLLAYPPQALAALAVYGFFAVLPVDAASAVGGFLGRTIGPLLPVTARARRNLARAMPNLDAAAHAAAIRAMWDNLGRVLGEYPHLDAIARNAGKGGRVEIAGETHIASLRAAGGPCILFSGHLANWEVGALATRAIGFPYLQVYRAPNNPLVDAMLRRARRVEDSESVRKGAAGARQALKALLSGQRVGMLVDQKMNDGISVPFFGRPAMTAPAIARFAMRIGCPVIPARFERLGGCRFRVSFHPPLAVPATGDRNADVAATMRAVNSQLEEWIRDEPGQWLWLHRRWPDS